MNEKVHKISTITITRKNIKISKIKMINRNEEMKRFTYVPEKNLFSGESLFVSSVRPEAEDMKIEQFRNAPKLNLNTEEEFQGNTENNLITNFEKPHVAAAVLAREVIYSPAARKRLKIKLTWDKVRIWPKSTQDCITKAACTKENPSGEDNTQYILNNVGGYVRAGQFLAIIGTSGAGKTTLLQYLSGKMFSDKLNASGEVKLNGSLRDDIDYEKFTAFVQQEDVLLESLTIKESLMFAANVKCKGEEIEREWRVEDLIEELQLKTHEDEFCGSNNVGHGERKRVSIGVELVTNPSLIFMDEPTTGMDTFTAQKIVGIIKNLTGRQRTIIVTIHQPNTEIINTLDMLMILTRGKTVYFNKAEEVTRYFTSLGFDCPLRENHADHLMKTLSYEFFLIRNPELASDKALAQKRYIQLIDEFAANQLSCN